MFQVIIHFHLETSEKQFKNINHVNVQDKKFHLIIPSTMLIEMTISILPHRVGRLRQCPYHTPRDNPALMRLSYLWPQRTPPPPYHH